MQASNSLLLYENSKTLQRPSLVFLLELQRCELEYILHLMSQGREGNNVMHLHKLGVRLGSQNIFFPSLNL